MGRTIKDTHFCSAVSRWRNRVQAFVDGKRLTMNALAAALELDASAMEASQREQFREALRAFAVARAAANPSDAIDAWIGRYLVSRGPHCLVDDARRRRVLAAIRDEERRKRERLSPVQLVNIRVREGDAARFRRLARADNTRLPAAFATLLDQRPRRPRRNAPSPAAPAAEQADLLKDLL